MIVTVRCLASLARLQPSPPEVNLPEGARLRDVYALLGLGPDPDVVPLLDGGPAGAETVLRGGALLELVPMVDGG